MTEPRWQLIATAPRDGSRVLLPGTMGYWSEVRQRWVDLVDADGFTYRPPTHWMPLPEPPEVSHD
jgi:Protein of unknown function (DUF551)